MQERNRIAAACAGRQQLPVNDLYPLAAAHPEYYVADGVHFNDEGRAALGAQVARAIRQQLAG